MTESFVDLSYRGLALGRRVKLTEVRPTTGTLEMPAPMPVGTAIGIATDDGVVLDATVVAIHEQVGGSDRPPGMVVAPTLASDAATQWWKQRVALPEAVKPQAGSPLAASPAVVVVSKRMTNPGLGVPVLVDDGQTTGVMDAIADPTEPEPAARLDDDGQRTTAMDAVDLAALGLDPSASSGELPAHHDPDDDGSSNGDADKKPGVKKKRRRR